MRVFSSILVITIVQAVSLTVVLSESCEGRNGVFCSSDCSSIEYCLNGMTDSITTMDCSTTDKFCNPTDHTCTSDTCSYTTHPFLCLSTGMFPDFKNCSLKYFCLTTSEPAAVCSCPDGEYYNINSLSCTAEGITSCTRQPPSCSGSTLCGPWEGDFSYVCVTQNDVRYPVMIACGDIDIDTCKCRSAIQNSFQSLWWQQNNRILLGKETCDVYVEPTQISLDSTNPAFSFSRSTNPSSYDTVSIYSDSSSTEILTDSTDSTVTVTSSAESSISSAVTTTLSTDTTTQVNTTTTQVPPKCSFAGDIYPDADCRFYWICITNTQAERRQCLPVDNSYFVPEKKSCTFGMC